MPKVSVIVPVYKVEAYLSRCVDSILGQSFSDFELWLVDDGSPDRCGDICDDYAQKDPRIRVIHKPNGGLSDARNAALGQITGTYISFIDSDDWVGPKFLAHMVEALERNHAELAICNMVAVYDDGKQGSCYQPAIREEILSGGDVFREILQPSACNKLYRAELFQSLRYPKGKLYEDASVYPDVLAQVRTLVLTGWNDYFYYKRQDSIMRKAYGWRNTELIDIVYASAGKLEALGQTAAANTMREFVYTQSAVAFAQLQPDEPAHKARLAEIRALYNNSYSKLLSTASSYRQKLRYMVLRISPWLHTAIWGKRMSQLT